MIIFAKNFFGGILLFSSYIIPLIFLIKFIEIQLEEVLKN